MNDLNGDITLVSPGERAQFEKSRHYTENMLQLMQLHANIFEWHGFPSYVDTDYIELTLMETGMCMLVRINGVIIPCEVVQRDIKIRNMKPIEFDIVQHEYNKNITKRRWNIITDDCVIIYNNVYGTSTMPYITWVSERMSELEHAEMKNARMQSLPLIVDYTAGTRHTALKMYKETMQGADFIFLQQPKVSTATTGVEQEKLTQNSLKLDKPFIALQMHDYRINLFNEFLNYLGINTSGVSKQSGVNTVEVEQNNQYVRIFQQNLRKQRLKAINRIEELGWLKDMKLTHIGVVEERGSEIYDDDTGTDSTSLDT